MSTHAVSIIIPAFNAAPTIARTLDSVRMQTLSPVDVIVVDDGSVDDTSAIVSEYIYRYGLSNWCLLRQQNGGPARARDAGIRLARGSHIALLDADDVWLPHHLEKSMDMMLKHRLELIGASLRTLPGDDLCYILDAKLMLFSNPYFTSTVLFSRAAYMEIGGFDLNQRYSEDFKLWLSFAWNGKRCGHVKRAMAIYRVDSIGPHRGLSSHLWRMQKNELENFRWLRLSGLTPAGWCYLAHAVSWLKFAYRLVRSR